MNIPDDVMAKAMTLAAMAQGTVAAGVEWGVEPITERKDIASDIARALLSERESATKAERERCAGIADARGRDCDGRYNESDDRYDMGGAASAEGIAAAIRKGDGE